MRLIPLFLALATLAQISLADQCEKGLEVRPLYMREFYLKWDRDEGIHLLNENTRQNHIVRWDGVRFLNRLGGLANFVQADFVMDMNSVIYIWQGKRDEDLIRHSTLISDFVAFAGRITIINGTIEWINNHSGHYGTPSSAFVQLKFLLEKTYSLDTSSIVFENVRNEPIPDVVSESDIAIFSAREVEYFKTLEEIRSDRFYKIDKKSLLQMPLNERVERLKRAFFDSPLPDHVIRLMWQVNIPLRTLESEFLETAPDWLLGAALTSGSWECLIDQSPTRIALIKKWELKALQMSDQDLKHSAISAMSRVFPRLSFEAAWELIQDPFSRIELLKVYSEKKPSLRVLQEAENVLTNLHQTLEFSSSSRDFDALLQLDSVFVNIKPDQHAAYRARLVQTANRLLVQRQEQHHPIDQIERFLRTD